VESSRGAFSFDELIHITIAKIGIKKISVRYEGRHVLFLLVFKDDPSMTTSHNSCRALFFIWLLIIVRTISSTTNGRSVFNPFCSSRLFSTSCQYLY